MNTIKEIYVAAQSEAAKSLDCGETTLDLHRACISGFESAGGKDPEDFDIFERYWRAHRQTLKTVSHELKQLEDKPSPSAKKAAARTAAAAAEAIAKAGKAAAVVVMLLLLSLFAPKANAQIYSGYVPIGGPNTNWAPVLNHLQTQANYAYVSLPTYTLIITNITTNVNLTICYGNQLLGITGTNAIVPMATLITNLSAANGYTNGGTFTYIVPAQGASVGMQPFGGVCVAGYTNAGAIGVQFQ